MSRTSRRETVKDDKEHVQLTEKPKGAKDSVLPWSVDTRGDALFTEERVHPTPSSLAGAAVKSVRDAGPPTAAMNSMKKSDSWADAPVWPEEDAPVTTSHGHGHGRKGPHSGTTEKKDPRDGSHKAAAPANDSDLQTKSGQGDRKTYSSAHRSSKAGRSTATGIPGIDISALPRATTRISFNEDDARVARPSPAKADEPSQKTATTAVEAVTAQVEKIGLEGETDKPVVPTSKDCAAAIPTANDSTDSVPLPDSDGDGDGDGEGDGTTGLKTTTTTTTTTATAKKKRTTRRKKKTALSTDAMPSTDVASSEVPVALEATADALAEPAATINAPTDVSATAVPASITAASVLPIVADPIAFVPVPASVSASALTPALATSPIPFIPPVPAHLSHLTAAQGPPVNQWVTCPFCHHCYVYPPIAPVSPASLIPASPSHHTAPV